ncbi:MAG: amino acid ABC transporter permease [Ruminococcaceae bacterium]|nr:amino acid ABC transporter permease [Oscillospiraceae bacterium]
MASSSFATITSELLVGFGENCLLFAMTLLMAIPLGLIITFGSMSKFKPLSWLTKVFVWIIRGTPLMLQLFVVMYLPGILLNIPMRNRMLAAVIAFVINYACYFSEIYRGGIESISRGQYEAGQVLGMTRTETFLKVVLLQVVKRIVPPMSNEIITLVKDTSLARVIAVAEILMCAERYAGVGVIWPLFYTGAFFLIFNGVLSLLFGYIEKKLNYFRS